LELSQQSALQLETAYALSALHTDRNLPMRNHLTAGTPMLCNFKLTTNLPPWII